MTSSPGSGTETRGVPTEAGWANLARAVDHLRTRPEPRAVEVANDVLSLALRSSRSSLPIRAHAPHEFVRVSDHVLIRRVREGVDSVSDTCAVGQVILLVTPHGALREVTVELIVQYGEVILDVADQVRLVVSDVVAELLDIDATLVRVVTTPAGAVDVAESAQVKTHVHVSDITVGNPHLVDPSDEDF